MDVSNEPPSPHYHALEGQSIVNVDWKLAFPKVELLCYNCKHVRKTKQHLLHDRKNFSKRKQLFPILTHLGLPTWCVMLNYKCESCNTNYQAKDGRLLSLLPPDVAGAYPVLPRYASGQCHLHRDVSDDVELLMKTYANGTFVSKTFHGKLGIVHSQKAEAYLSRSPMCRWISFNAFTGGTMPPTPKLICMYF
jgi:hypothetical protein